MFKSICVDASGCIFVWKLPAPFSSKMVQRVEEQYYQLSPIIKDPPIVLSQIKFIEGDDSLCKFNPTDDVLQNSRSNHARQRMYGQGGNTAESTTFKFSISRLPKWAQNKVTGCDMIPTRPKCSSLQQVGLQAFSGSVRNGDRAVMHRELKTPSKDNVQYSVKACCTETKSSEETDSGASATPIEASRSFALDRRWMTIHTVCLDLLNSPEVWDMKKMQVPQSYTNLSGDGTVENPADNRYIKLLSGGGDCGVDNSYPDPTSMVDNHINRKGTISNDMSTLNNSDSMCNSISQLDTRNTVACCGKDACKLSQATQPDSFKGEGQTMEATNPSTMVEDSEECNTFNLNFSNLSEDVKGQESSSRRKYPSHFVVRDNFNRGPQKQFGTPSGAMSSIGDTVPSISSEDHHSVQISEKSQRTTEQDLNSAQILLRQNCINSCGDSVGLCTKPEESNSDMNRKTETIISCKQALIRLDSETDKALELFSKLDSLASGVNILTGPEAQFYEEAAEMLPLIAKKVHTIAKLAQSTQNNTCRKSEIDVPSFEPFLGTFAENISQRVVEILKKNSATL